MFLSVMALLACHSKFSEPSPEEVKMGGMKLDDRFVHKAKMDSRIEQIQESTEKIKRLLEILRRAKNQNPEEVLGAYTPIDLVIDLNNELKKRIPQEYKGKMRRYGKIDLPQGLVSEGCLSIDTILETQAVPGNEEHKVDLITYYLKTCTAADYLPIAEVLWEQNSFNLNVKNENLEKLFVDLFKHEVSRGSCTVNTGDNSNIISVTCRNMETVLNKYEHAIITDMSYFEDREIAFLVNADIYNSQTNKRKAGLKIEVPREGLPRVQFPIE